MPQDPIKPYQGMVTYMNRRTPNSPVRTFRFLAAHWSTDKRRGAVSRRREVMWIFSAQPPILALEVGPIRSADATSPHSPFQHPVPDDGNRQSEFRPQG